MKSISLCISILVISLHTVFAQVDRSHYPEPAPAPSINIADAETFVLPNGLKYLL